MDLIFFAISTGEDFFKSVPITDGCSDCVFGGSFGATVGAPLCSFFFAMFSALCTQNAQVHPGLCWPRFFVVVSFSLMPPMLQSDHCSWEDDLLRFITTLDYFC